MTEAETVVWSELRRRQMKCRIRRQHPIGPFIVDFVCIRHWSIFEIDGTQHFESSYDVARTAWLEARGFRVMRFWNHEVFLEIDGVMEAVHSALMEGLGVGRRIDGG